MSITIHRNLLLELHCDAKNKCRFREPLNDNDWGGSMWGGFEGKTEDEIMQKARNAHWIIEGGKAICPECNPATHIQLPKFVSNVCQTCKGKKRVLVSAPLEPAEYDYCPDCFPNGPADEPDMEIFL